MAFHAPPLQWPSQYHPGPKLQNFPPYKVTDRDAGYIFFKVQTSPVRIHTHKRRMFNACFECWNHGLHRDYQYLDFHVTYLFVYYVRFLKLAPKKWWFFIAPASCNELWSTYVANAALAEPTSKKKLVKRWCGWETKMAFSKGDEHLQVGSNGFF